MPSCTDIIISRLPTSSDYLSPAQVAKATEMSKNALAVRRSRRCAPAFERLASGRIVYPREAVVVWLKTGMRLPNSADPAPSS